MKPRCQVLVAAFLLVSCTAPLWSQPQASPAVVFSLEEGAYWPPALGADAPAFTLYDNRDLIFFDPNAGRYEYVRLTEEEDARLREEVVPKDLPALEHSYSRVVAMCQNMYFFYFGGETPRLVDVYGHPTHGYDGFWATTEIPQSLRRCFNTVIRYRNQRAAPWVPERVEVLAWNAFPTERELTEWPTDWPDLESPDTIDRGSVYSVYLPADLYDEFIALLDATKGLVTMNGRKMAISYRTPIPGEEVFSQDFDEPDYENTPLHSAAFRGDDQRVASLLADGADVNAMRADGKTALHLAVENGREDVARRLIANGADIEAATGYGNTPLLCALDFREAETGMLLLAEGAAAGASNSAADTGLHYATDDRLTGIASELTASGLDIDTRNDANDSPLYGAARDGATGVVELLLASGAEANAAKPDGRTALHAAVFNGHREAVELLIAHGVDVNAETSEGHTPLDYALVAGRDEVAALLRETGGTSGAPDEDPPPEN